MVNNNKTE